MGVKVSKSSEAFYPANLVRNLTNQITPFPVSGFWPFNPKNSPFPAPSLGWVFNNLSWTQGFGNSGPFPPNNFG